MLKPDVFFAVAAVLVATAGCAPAATEPDLLTATITIAEEDGRGLAVGTVEFIDTAYGLLVVPELRNLSPGPHAAHVHENPDCSEGVDGAPAGAAGGHYDPEGTGTHAGPYAQGHRGDLPNLIVESDGATSVPVLAPKLTASELRGRSIMIHAGADRYDEHSAHKHPKGGHRMYCGVIN